MAGRNDIKLVVGGTPRAELLPPELEQEKKAASQRRSLLAGLVVVFVVVGLAYAGVTGLAQISQARLDELNVQSADILAQQGEYIEVRQLAAQVSAANEARKIGIGPEIDWMTKLNEIAIASSGYAINIVTIKATAETPITPFEQSTVIFQKPRIAEITITGLASSPNDVAGWLAALPDVEGVADASLTSVEFVNGAYSYIIVIHLNTDAYTLRGEEDADTEGDSGTETPVEPDPAATSPAPGATDSPTDVPTNEVTQ